MAVVARAAEHGKAAVELLRQQHTVAVEGQEGVLALVECLEVESIAYAYGGAVIAVAPGNPVAVFNPGHTRVVLIVRVNHVGVARLELDGGIGYFPVYAVGREAGEDIHAYSLVVAAEHSGETVAERYHGRVENRIGYCSLVAVDNRVECVAPHHIGAAFGAFFPGKISHNYSLVLCSERLNEKNREFVYQPSSFVRAASSASIILPLSSYLKGTSRHIINAGIVHSITTMKKVR